MYDANILQDIDIHFFRKLSDMLLVAAKQDMNLWQRDIGNLTHPLPLVYDQCSAMQCQLLGFSFGSLAHTPSRWQAAVQREVHALCMISRLTATILCHSPNSRQRVTPTHEISILLMIFRVWKKLQRWAMFYREQGLLFITYYKPAFRFFSWQFDIQCTRLTDCSLEVQTLCMISCLTTILSHMPNSLQMDRPTHEISIWIMLFIARNKYTLLGFFPYFYLWRSRQV